MNQPEFAHALLNADAPVPTGVIDPQGRPAGRRFDVYRNNVIASLCKAMADAYPAVQRIVGEAFFKAMANVYVRAHPPKTPIIQQYGDDFADWLEGFEPAARLPYLPDVARLEWLRRRTYHAADATCAAPDVLARIAAADLPDARLHFIPAMAVLSSPYPVLAIWRKNLEAPELALPASGQTVLVARPETRVEMHAFAPPHAEFLRLLSQHSLGVALDHMAQAKGFELGAALAAILQARLLAQVTIEPDAS
ncbi:MAG: DNA-binding domain-containing protein [Paracoccaceae bacterium]